MMVVVVVMWTSIVVEVEVTILLICCVYLVDIVSHQQYGGWAWNPVAAPVWEVKRQIVSGCDSRADCGGVWSSSVAIVLCCQVVGAHFFPRRNGDMFKTLVVTVHRLQLSGCCNFRIEGLPFQHEPGEHGRDAEGILLGTQ